jgi:hypothetical protein
MSITISGNCNKEMVVLTPLMKQATELKHMIMSITGIWKQVKLF